MPVFLSHIRNTIWSFVSPRSCRMQGRRVTPSRVSPISPNKRATAQKRRRRNRRSSSARRSQSQESASSGGSGGAAGSPVGTERGQIENAEERAFEDGETLLEKDDSQGSEEALESVKPDHWNDEVDANDDTLVVTEEQYEFHEGRPVYQNDVRLGREKQIADLYERGWSYGQIELFSRLCMRGLEPLMPGNWVMDFDTIPLPLFAKDDDRAFIKSVSDRDFRAIRALSDLISLGPRVRDAMASQKPAEDVIRRGISAYAKWACSDAKLDSFVIPNFALVAGPVTVSAQTLQDRIIDKLEYLAGRYEIVLVSKSSLGSAADENTEHPPVPETSSSAQVQRPQEPAINLDLQLYGAVMSSTLLAFVGYEPNTEDRELRTIATFDFGKAEYDVWNSLAIAIFIIHCRNEMMELRKYACEPLEEGEASDPDA